MPSKDPAHQPEQIYVEAQDTEWADPDLPNTFPSGDTVEADRRDAKATHGASQPGEPAPRADDDDDATGEGRR